MMLWKLLVEYLRPQRRLLIAVVVFQLAQSIASLYLPTLNADIIDEGVAKGDTGYILRVGGLMLFITLLQIVCAVVAVYFGAKAAMGMGRDLRGAIFTGWGSSPSRRSPGSGRRASSPAPPTTSSRSSSWC
jgi:ATP-binding cassette subfamily B multidrug efflux pump